MRATVKKSCMSEGASPSSRFQGERVRIPDAFSLSDEGRFGSRPQSFDIGHKEPTLFRCNGYQDVA
jgi:hypothetical protein